MEEVDQCNAVNTDGDEETAVIDERVDLASSHLELIELTDATCD
jgi:hypothetical protein